MISAPVSFTTANANLRKNVVVAFEIDGYSRVFTTKHTGISGQYPWISDVSDLSYEVSALDGSSSLSDITVTVIDYQKELTTDYPTLTLEGKVCRLKIGFLGQTYSDFVTLFTGKVDSVPTSDANMTYQFIAKDTRLNLKQLIYRTGDDGQPTDSSHIKTVLGNPIDIVKSILFDYIGLLTTDVDSTKFDLYRDQLFAGTEFSFDISSPPEAKAFIESQIFKALGGYLRANNLGKLTPQFFYPIAGANVPVMTLTRDNIVGIPEIQQADLVNCVSFRFDKDSNSYTSESVQINQASVDKYGMQGQAVIESDGMRSGFQGYFISRLTSSAIFGRYGDKNPRLEVTCLWDAVLLELGDMVGVTHTLVPDRKTGIMGVTDMPFEIEGIKWNFSDCTVTLTLVDAAYIAALGRWRIAPDSKVDWTSAITDDKNRYMYISGADGKYSDATDGHTLA